MVQTQNWKEAKVVDQVDHLSALPVDILYQIMARAGMRAWEVARTCVLSRHWRLVSASAPCVDLRLFCYNHGQPPENFANFVNGFLSSREKGTTLDTLRLLHVPDKCEHWYDDEHTMDDHHEQPTYDSSDVARWFAAAIQGRARVIEVTDHPEHSGLGFKVDRVSLASTNLQQLKLSHAVLGARTLEGLSSECPSLQVLELRECVLEGRNNISSASLKTLSMDKCRIRVDLSITAPNLVSLRCVKTYNRAPLFSTMGSLATTTIILVDSFLTDVDLDELEKEDDDYALTLSYSGENASYLYDDFYGTDADSISTCQYEDPADDCGDEQSSADSEDRSKNGNTSILGGHHIHGPRAGPEISGRDPGRN